LIQGDFELMVTSKTASILGATGLIALITLGPLYAGTVSYKGQTFTSDSRVVGGKVYVPLADVAKLLNGRVAGSGGSYQIVTAGGSSQSAAGGANQINGTKGAVGDWLFDGRWRFRVNKVNLVPSYSFKYSSSTETDNPSGTNDLLVVMDCTIKNGLQNSDEPILTAHGLATQATAVTDDQGQSYAPVDFDVRGGAIVPGGAKNFTVVFSVPKGTKLTSLIFSIYSYANSTKLTNARIDLANLEVNQ
jgi:hypothetical protein